MRLFSTLFVITLISLSAQARQNHCDHGDGKAIGTVLGGAVGAGGGAAISGGKTAPTIIGGILGALVGRGAGDSADDQRDFDECGTDSASFQRGVDRDQRQADERYERDSRRQDEIDYDRDMSRRDRGPGPGYGPGPRPRPFPGGGYPPPRPRRMMYQCQEARRGRFVLVHLPSNRVVQEWGRDLYGCQSSERQSNGY